MDFLSDNFISYDDDFMVKQEKSNEQNMPLDSFFSIDPAFAFPAPIPKTLKNLLDSEDQTFSLDPSEFEDWPKDRKKRQPFNIIKAKKEDTRLCSPESFDVKIECDDKLVTRTKRILKREKAKQRIKIKQEATFNNVPSVINTPIPSTPSDVVNNPDLDDKTKKKMIQMIRNRISAQSSRDRKKVYMVQLEDVKSQLADENSKLNFEKELLLKELRKLEETQKKLIDENEELKRAKGQKYGMSHLFERESEDETTEDDSEGEEFSNMFKTIIGSGFGKMTGNNKKFHKSTLAFATMISVVMMLNIAKQGGEIVQDGAAWIKNSNLSGIQKKLLENTELAEDLQELTEEVSNSKEWDFFDRLKPLLQNLEAEHRKLSMDTQADGTTGSPQSPPNIIKMEELVQDDLLAEPECLLPIMGNKIGSIFGDERMNVESFRFGSDINRMVGLPTVKYFGSKNGLIKFTQETEPKKETQKDQLFVKEEWHQVIKSHNIVSFNS